MNELKLRNDSHSAVLRKSIEGRSIKSAEMAGDGVQESSERSGRRNDENTSVGLMTARKESPKIGESMWSVTWEFRTKWHNEMYGKENGSPEAAGPEHSDRKIGGKFRRERRLIKHTTNESGL